MIESGGSLFGKLGVVIAPGFGAIAAANQEEVVDFSGFHRVNNRTGVAQGSIASKPNQDGLLRLILLPAAQLQGFLNDGRKIFFPIFFFNVSHIRETNHAGGEDAVLIGFAGFHQAVGGHQDTAGQIVKLALLDLPGAAVITHQVRILFQARVSKSGQHFAVGVYVHAFPGRLFEQLQQVVQIVTGDYDEGALFLRNEGLGRLRMTKGSGIGMVEQFHRLQVHLPKFHHHPNQIVKRQGFIQQSAQAFVQVIVYRLITTVKRPGMVCIGSHSLEAV